MGSFLLCALLVVVVCYYYARAATAYDNGRLDAQQNTDHRAPAGHFWHWYTRGYRRGA